ncbi:BRCA2 repeat family protein [Trichomonas vaginalis G3]|uniref:BRCA2 repeat family protein n=1 Tax=Trichomonas vaginalis (strain ATCC PRA-98 / G3) TaxID=412133 RepID=A2ERV5_TRIV3|nr:breast cancer type 2 susceptibility protein (BRCA2) family [Trichomonas vaginalis G3]EAY04622.1 BRCA2 repeat family protein [Trichomonas vaginalis G3]KAI5539615.1 breast cancer type 2 susceptibility protein (BRCA2) family [Trichomonas vaginalis G3]|eukprot:XP_001316845.1 BRCA2 repeat family protein [Trichomonas vaginalis G3]
MDEQTYSIDKLVSLYNETSEPNWATDASNVACDPHTPISNYDFPPSIDVAEENHKEYEENEDCNASKQDSSNFSAKQNENQDTDNSTNNHNDTQRDSLQSNNINDAITEKNEEKTNEENISKETDQNSNLTEETTDLQQNHTDSTEFTNEKLEISNQNAEIKEETEQNNENTDENNKEEKFIGFMTASGKKPLTPSEDSLKKAQKLLENNKNIANESISTNQKEITAKFDESNQDSKEIPNENTNNEQLNDKNQFLGFTTANGKKSIVPSEESMKKAKNLMKSAEIERENQFVGFTTANGKKSLNPSEESMKRAQNMFNNDENQNQFVGFTTASGKKYLQPSKESLRKAENLMKSAEEEFKGFTTAIGKRNLNPSEDALRKAQNMFSDNNEQQFVGFTTANGKKPIIPSEESMKKAQQIMDNAREESKQEFVGFSTANGKKSLIPSEESLRKAENLMKSAEIESEKQFVGFTTANGKKSLNSSEDSLRKVQGMFNVNNEQQFIGFSTANGKKPIVPSEESLRRAQQIMNAAEQESKQEFAGFSTANGKKSLMPSEESLRKVQNIFNDNNNEQQFSGFSTANGKKPIIPSEASIRRAQQIMDSAENESKQEFSGFSTANGKRSLNPSEESLRKAQNIFNDSNEQQFSGFSTANGKKALVPSEESMKKAQQIMNDAEQESKQQFSGFSTANGKKSLNPSEESLRKAQSIMDSAEKEYELKRTPKTSISKNSEIPLPSFDDLSQRSSQSSAVLRTPNRTTFLASPSPSSFKFSPSGMALSNYVGNSAMATPTKPKPTSTLVTSQSNRNSQTPQGKKPFKPPTMTSKTAPVTPMKSDTKTIAKPDRLVTVFEMPNNIRRETLKEYSKYKGVPKREYDPMEFTSDDALNYRFPPPDYRGVNDIYVALLEKNVDPLLLKPSWVRNHYKWIVWKLKCLDLSYKEINQQNNEQILTFDNVLSEMLFRIQREIYEAKRSSLKLIHERDAPPNLFIILAVSKILDDGLIELTDGWYSIQGALDINLNKLLKEGKINVGDKLRICNATLDGEDACDPLESKANSTRLMMRMNSVRRAKWYESLGFQKIALFPVNIRSLVGNGGLVPYIEVIIQKKLPLLFRESKSDGTSVVRNQTLQNIYERERENQLQNDLEKARIQWSKELEEDGTDSLNECPKLKIYLKSDNPSLYLNSLQNDDRKELEFYIKKHEKEVDEFYRNYTEEFMKDYKTESTPFFTVLCTDLCPFKNNDCEVTFWRPSLELFDTLQEGLCVRIYHLGSSETRGNRLTSKGNPHIDILSPQPKLSRFLFRPRHVFENFSELWRFGKIGLSTGTFVDINGFALMSENNCLFVVDGSAVLTCIEARLSKPEDILNLNGFVTIENLKYQSLDDSSGIILLLANESTVFNRSPNKQNRFIWDYFQNVVKPGIDFKKYSKFMKRIILGQRTKLNHQISDLTVSKPLSSILTFLPFDKIEFAKKDDKHIVFFGLTGDENSIDNLTNNDYFVSGLNLMMKVTDGIGTSFLRINALIIYKFFVSFSTQISNSMRRKLTKFYDDFFSQKDEKDILGHVRSKILENFQIDTNSIETVTRVLIYHGYICYDEKTAKNLLTKIAVSPVFPFRAEEWMNFSVLLSDALTECEFSVEYFSGDNGDNIVINASSIGAVDNKTSIKSLMESF